MYLINRVDTTKEMHEHLYRNKKAILLKNFLGFLTINS